MVLKKIMRMAKDDGYFNCKIYVIIPDSYAHPLERDIICRSRYA